MDNGVCGDFHAQRVDNKIEQELADSCVLYVCRCDHCEQLIFLFDHLVIFVTFPPDDVNIKTTG